MTETRGRYDAPSGAAIGWTAFAGFMLILVGVFHAIAGLAGIIENEFYSAVPAAGTEATGDVYFLQFDATTWGWIHLIGGLVVLFAGFGLFRGAVWARSVGVIVATVSVIVNFAGMPWYPVWSTAMIAVAIAAIWALRRTDATSSPKWGRSRRWSSTGVAVDADHLIPPEERLRVAMARQ